jgi:hypothetical protein
MIWALNPKKIVNIGYNIFTYIVPLSFENAVTIQE